MINPLGDPITALLVEDNLADAELIETRLEPAMGTVGAQRVQTVRADSLSAACAALRHQPVDVVILDLSLPDARGLDALYRVRAAAPDVPVIVLTGSDDQRLALRALHAGAQDYVSKPPPDGATLRRILRYARERHRLLKELDTAVHVSATAVRKWRLLAEAGKVLAASVRPADALHRVARLLVPDAADCFVLWVGGDDGTTSVVEVAHADGARAGTLRRRVRAVLAEPGAACDGTGLAAAPDGAGDDRAEEVLRLVFASLGETSGTAVPLHLGGRVRGLLVLAVAPGRHDTTVDVEFCASLADRIGLALEQARLLRRTERAVTTRDRAVGIVSHDLGNPLSTIEICAAALLEPAPPPIGGIRSMAQLIQRSAAWMRRIVDDLLDRASLDAGTLALHRQPTTASEVVGAAQVMFAPVAEEQDVRFIVESETDLPRIDADAQRLVQVLSNLLGNAMKFTPAGGRVVLSARAAPDDRDGGRSAAMHGSGVRFAVSDSGPGIPREDQAHVFDWYWHSRSGERSGERRGTGLGLAIAKGLVAAHGGSLHVDSAPGRGSTFWFTLPAAGELAGGANGSRAASLEARC